MPNNYFNSLNYTIGNEDASLEIGILPEKINHVFAVAGSGSRIIPIFAKNPQHVTCVDSSIEQIYLTELRVSSVKELSHKAFIAFWGYPGEKIPQKERQEIFNGLHLSDKTKEFLRQLFEQNSWNSLLYEGKWEKAFKRISGMNRMIIGKKGLGIFNCRTKEEQDDYLRTQFPRKAWALAVLLLGNATVFNALLYKGSFPKKNIQGSLHSFYMGAFQRLFEQDIARKSFFLQLIFFEKLRFQEGLPIECDPELFNMAKKNIQNAQIRYIHGDSVKEAKSAKIKIDFLSFSDIASYLKPPKEQNFLQEIKNNLSNGAVVISRYYLRVPENLNIEGYKNITNNHKEAIKKEKVQMYSFGIYKKI